MNDAVAQPQALIDHRFDFAPAGLGFADDDVDIVLFETFETVGQLRRAQVHDLSVDARAAVAGGSVGSRVRLAIQQIHASDLRRARQTLEALLKAHPNNDVLQSLLKRAALTSSGRPWFLVEPPELVNNPSESDLRAVLALFATNTLAPADRATLDGEKFSSITMFDAPDGQTFRSGTMNKVPFRFQNPTRFEGIDANASSLRVTYRILGATTVDGRDALLIEPLRAKVEK